WVATVGGGEDLITGGGGPPLRPNAYAFAHNGILGFPTTKPIRLPAEWPRLLREGRGRQLDALWGLLPAGQRASGEWIDDTLRARAEEKGLLARTPLAGEFPRPRVDLARAGDPGAGGNAGA